MRVVVLALSLALLLLAMPGLAKRSRAKAKSPHVEALARPPTSDESAKSVLARCRALYDALEAHRVLPLVDALLERDDLTANERVEAYLLKGSSLAVTGDPIDAEPPFRLLFRLRPDFELAQDPPPKIMAVFRKVQAEELAILEQTERLLRQRLIEGLALQGEHPTEAKGGLPLLFRYRVKDPTSAVDSVVLRYRRSGDRDYSALALEQTLDGAWLGAIPGEWTASEAGFVLEYVVETRDAKGALLVAGSESVPLSAKVSPGVFERAPPLPAWSFWTAAGTTGALFALSGAFAVGTGLTQAAHDAEVEKGFGGVADGAHLRAQRELGSAFTIAQYVTLAAAGVAALATGSLALFVDWEGRQELDETVRGTTTTRKVQEHEQDG